MAGRFDPVLALLLAVGCRGPASPPQPPVAETSVGRLGVELSAQFKDAAGIAVGMAVHVAGTIRGRVTRLESSGEGTRVWLELERNLEVWPGARLRKQTGSTTGTVSLDLWPGGPKHDWDKPIDEGREIQVEE